MFSHPKTQMLHQKHRQQELERKAEKHRIVREALKGRRIFRLYSPFLADLGTRFVHLGLSMQERFGSDEQRYSKPSPSLRGA
jgi:hypothetical protein